MQMVAVQLGQGLSGHLTLSLHSSNEGSGTVAIGLP